MVGAVAGAAWGLWPDSPPAPTVSAAPQRHASSSPPAVVGTPDAPRPVVEQALRRPTRHHPLVPAAPPTTFRYDGSGYTVRATVCGMPYVLPLDPPGNQHTTVCWVKSDFGYPPGSDGKGTTYVLGHSWSRDPLEVLNPVSSRAMAQAIRHRTAHRIVHRNGIVTYPVTVLNGDVVTLHTKTGVLHYTVRDAYAVSKSHAGLVHSVMDEHVKNRVLIITCGENHGIDYHYDVIIEAFLTAARPS